jgi:hypothetical protein
MRSGAGGEARQALTCHRPHPIEQTARAFFPHFLRCTQFGARCGSKVQLARTRNFAYGPSDPERLPRRFVRLEYSYIRPDEPQTALR